MANQETEILFFFENTAVNCSNLKTAKGKMKKKKHRSCVFFPSGASVFLPFPFLSDSSGKTKAETPLL